jgi:peptidoglycan/LPS O-acetylase OafA/YrhL
LNRLHIGNDAGSAQRQTIVTLVRKRPAQTLGDSFNPRDNSLNFLRVVLAVGVIISHAWPVGGFGFDPKFGDSGIGHWAVAGFFAISGYLVTGSRVGLDLRNYLLRRAARILPGFWACLAFTAFLVAPITAWLTGRHYTLAGALGYVFGNATLVIVSPGIDDTLSGVPHPDVWNDSLWTLKWEFLAYIAIGVAMSVPAFRRRAAPYVAAFVGLTGLHAVLWAFGAGPPIVESVLWLGTAFASGVVLFVLRDRVIMHGGIAVAAVLALVGCGLTSSVDVFGQLPTAYLMMWLATRLPLQRAFRRNDISYGMYIYAFVVQQCLQLAGVAGYGVAVYAVVAIVATVPLAYASWFLVEKPAKAAIGSWAKRRSADTSGRWEFGR